MGGSDRGLPNIGPAAETPWGSTIGIPGILPSGEQPRAWLLELTTDNHDQIKGYDSPCPAPAFRKSIMNTEQLNIELLAEPKAAVLPSSTQ